MTATIHWAVELTALSSIVHAGNTHGTDTLLRREHITTAGGGTILIPVISGNAFRGRLRRVAEELLRDVLQLEGEIPLTAAYALRNGGSLYKSGREPLTGRRRAAIRDLVPLLGVFGCAAGSTILDGALEVGKVIPHAAETEHLTGVPHPLSVFDLVQMEEYSHADDLDDHSGPEVAYVDDNTASNQMRYAVETFPAGTKFASYLRLTRASDHQISFFTDVLHAFATFAQLGGRRAIGHGRCLLDTRDELVAGSHDDTHDWRTVAHERRSDVIEALAALA